MPSAALPLRPRHLAAVALALGLTVAGFILARALAERDARRESERRVEIAAAQIRSRLEEAASLTQSLQRFMFGEGVTGVTNDEFARNALRWLFPVDLPAAAWAEEVRADDRTAYEQRIGEPIVSPGQRRNAAPPGSSYLPATLISGFAPMNLRGVDLNREPGIAVALRRAIVPGGVGATPVAIGEDGTRGVFLVAPAPNLVEGVLRPGAVVIFVSEAMLRSAARNAPGLRLPAGDLSLRDRAGGHTVRQEFQVAGQQFAVDMPKQSVSGAPRLLPWLILAGGLALAALAGALGVNAARRTKARVDLDRIFTLSSDLIAVADLHGHFTRLNPAAERILGYTEGELLARPYLDFVHPEDRESTAAQGAAIGEGETTLSFENRYVRNDGLERVLEWTVNPVVEEGVMYGVARDVTERRQAESEVKRLAAEQAALRRVATLVAEGATPNRVFDVVRAEVEQMFGIPNAILMRFDADGTATLLATPGDYLGPVGKQWPLEGDDSAVTRVYRTGRAARADYTAGAIGPLAEAARRGGTLFPVAVPVLVDGALWGAMSVGSRGAQPPPDLEGRLAKFTELLATAIANAESRADLAASEARARELAEEQAALRRVATLVAEGATPSRVFDAVRQEIARMFELPNTILMRYDADGLATMVATHAQSIRPVGSRWTLDKEDTSSVARVFWTGRAARTPDLTAEARGPMSEAARTEGARFGVGVPVVVDGALWGTVSVASPGPAPPPADLERRLAEFTDLLGIAIANAESHADLEASEAHARELANEQAALRRVATLVAQGASPDELFSAVAEEVAGLIGIPVVGVYRYEADRTFTTLGLAGDRKFAIGSRWPVVEEGLAGMILATGRPARKDDYSTMPGPLGEALRKDQVASAAGVPIMVDGSIWGFMAATCRPEEFIPADTEQHLERFTELVATGVSNATVRADLIASRTRVVAAADETRRRLERDLHDGIQQWLVALALRARKAAGVWAAGESAVQELSDLADDLVAVTDELREISRGIHPAILSDAGLDDALEALARRSAILVDLDVSFQGRYDPTLEATLYYVAAESITNAVKHAQASTVTMRGGRRGGAIELEIRDDGVGGADPSRGTGLLGLKDRVDTLGGTISFASETGAGTTIRVILPAGPRDAEDPRLPRSTEASAPASG